jgi:hypothetical protein
VVESTISSPYFSVNEEESYKIYADISGDSWDVYMFFYDEENNWVDFVDSKNKFSSNGDGV